jgi:uncharacterized protein YunC (DUF1805 family)
MSGNGIKAKLRKALARALLAPKSNLLAERNEKGYVMQGKIVLAGCLKADALEGV